MVRPLGPPVRGRPPDPVVTARPLAGLEVRPLALMPRPPDLPVRVRSPRPPDPPVWVRPPRQLDPPVGARRRTRPSGSAACFPDPLLSPPPANLSRHPSSPSPIAPSLLAPFPHSFPPRPLPFSCLTPLLVLGAAPTTRGR